MKYRISLAVSVVSLALSAPLVAQENFSIAWRGYGQFTAERADGDGSVEFGTERLRPRVVFSNERLTGLLQLDLAASNSSDERPGVMANVVMDAYAEYALASGGRLRFGQYKTPLGMDFNQPAHLLDITKRGVEYGLTLNRAFGLMYSGGGRIGYDIGVFNPPGRSAAGQYDDAQVGQDNAVAARLRFDDGPWHAEVAIAQAENAGGPSTPDYDVMDIGLRYTTDRWFTKFEWIEGDNVRGQTDRTEQVYFLHGSYRLTPTLSLVGRHYRGRSEIAGVSSDLTNTYLGITLWPEGFGRFQPRLQANYVLAGGDEASYTGLRGFRDDAVFVQFQILIESE